MENKREQRLKERSSNLIRWRQTCARLQTFVDIRKNLCGGCGKAKLYDNTGKEYLITINTPTEDVDSIVDKIREVNFKNKGH